MMGGNDDSFLPDLTARVTIVRVENGRRIESSDLVVVEFPLTIFFNHREVVRLVCTPDKLDCLAVGFLESEGLLSGRDDEISVMVDKIKGHVWVETLFAPRGNSRTSQPMQLAPRCVCGFPHGNLTPVQSWEVTSNLIVEAGVLLDLMHDFQARSHLHRITGGVHGAALCDQQGIIVFCDDIARHNAVDKVFGYCRLNNVSTTNSILLTSGRVSSEIVLKSARRGVPVVASKAAPTSLSVQLAQELGVCIVGFVRGRRLSVFTNAWRVSC